MGKTISATDLLNAGRLAPASSGTERTLAERGSTSATRQLDAQTLQLLGTESAGRSDAQATSSSVVQPPTYQRTTVFLTPDQRRWLKQISKALPVEGLSASDVVRLAVNRLQQDVNGGLPLVEALTSQAHLEAVTLVGRRNRGLPPRTGSTDTGDGSRSGR